MLAKKYFVASTPANAAVKSFLGIPVADSIDFIRWRITLTDGAYKLLCTYGISKPNTNGFYDGGKKTELGGKADHTKGFYILHSGNKTLKLTVLNDDILHISDNDNSLMVGNGGWSYSLNNTTALGSDRVNTTSLPIVFKDSAVFDGRTPCNVPGIIPAGKLCYKLKWRIILYANTAAAQQGKCKVFGTSYRAMNGRPCTWRLSKNDNGDLRYELIDDTGKPFVWLRAADSNILYFTDANGKLLVGNEDFSYSLNRLF